MFFTGSSPLPGVLALCHLFIGALLGMLIYQRSGYRWAVPVAAVAALIPDMIDKPLGHLLLKSTLDYGRIYAHSLLFLAATMVVGFLLWRKDRFLAVAVGAGVLSHLVLDAMWMLPITLFWPALGPFPQHHFPDYLESSLVTELTAPSEWLFLVGLVLIVFSVYRSGIWSAFARAADVLLPYRKYLAGGMLFLAGVYWVTGVDALSADPLFGQEELILAGALLVGGAFLWRVDPSTVHPAS